MSKTLILSRSLYPRPGGSSYVMENLCKHLSSKQFYILTEKSLLFKRKEYTRNYEFPSIGYLYSDLSFKGRGTRFFKIFKLLICPVFLIQILFKLKQNGIKKLLVVYPDWYFTMLSNLIIRFTNIKCDSYFHNTYLENMKGLNRLIALRVQKQIFKNSQRIFVMSEGLLEYYKNTYPFYSSKFKVLPHVFSQDRQIETCREKNKIGFTGNFNESNLEATIRILNVLKKFPEKKVHFATPVPKGLLKLRGIDTSYIQYEGYLNDQEYLEFLNSCDHLVLTHGFKGGYSKIEYETIFPTRTLPLLAAGGPMIVHSPDSSFLSKFLIKKNLKTVITSSDELVIQSQLIEIFKEENLTETLKAQYELLDYFSPANVLKNYI